MIKYAEHIFEGKVNALFGGSFNPIHIGHLLIARDILEDFGFKKVIFVPAFIQPLKEELLLPPELRLQLLKASIKNENYFDIWDYEIRKKDVSYTFETLKAYSQTYGERPTFIMGLDSFLSFHRWKEPKKILSLSTIIVAQRPGYRLDCQRIFRDFGVSIAQAERGKVKPSILSEANVIFYRGRQLDISSTEIRNRLKKGKSIKYMVTEEAEKILRRWWKDALQENV